MTSRRATACRAGRRSCAERRSTAPRSRGGTSGCGTQSPIRKQPTVPSSTTSTTVPVRSGWPGASGVPDLGAALDGVLLDVAAVVLDFGADTPAAAEALLSLAEQRGVGRGRADRLARRRPDRGAGPHGRRRRPGHARRARRARCRRPGAAASRPSTPPSTTTPAPRTPRSSASPPRSASPTCARSPTPACRSTPRSTALEFRWAVTAEQFPSIAKLRAARRIWDRVAELCGAADDRRGQRQHAVTSAAMLTRRDPWVNMLRTTIGCFAAAVGGADSITVLPFDAAIGVSDEFARRIARNTQSVLHDESSLARVIDAGGGSWFVESLTDVARREGVGRCSPTSSAPGERWPALDDGAIAELVADTQARRADDIAHRRAPITGVSEFAVRRRGSRSSASRCPPRRLRTRSCCRGALRRRSSRQLRDRADAAARAAEGVPRRARAARRAQRARRVRREPVPGGRGRVRDRRRQRRRSWPSRSRRGHAGRVPVLVRLVLRRAGRERGGGAARSRRDPGLAGRRPRASRSKASTATCTSAATRSRSLRSTLDTLGVK